MDAHIFIKAAYVFTALALAVLCFGTWLASRRVRRALKERTTP